MAAESDTQDRMLLHCYFALSHVRSLIDSAIGNTSDTEWEHAQTGARRHLSAVTDNLQRVGLLESIHALMFLRWCDVGGANVPGRCAAVLHCGNSSQQMRRFKLIPGDSKAGAHAALHRERRCGRLASDARPRASLRESMPCRLWWQVAFSSNICSGARLRGDLGGAHRSPEVVPERSTEALRYCCARAIFAVSRGIRELSPDGHQNSGW